MHHRFLVRVFLALLLPQASLLVAADREADSEAANASVAAALIAESEGDFLTRQRLLAEAELSGDFAPAKWHRGQLLQSDGSWSDIRSNIKQNDDDKKLAQYELAREGLNDTFENHVALARACAKQGLLSQCRSHLSRALEFQPDNAQLRQALGYRQVGTDWLSPADVAEFESRTQATLQSVEKYGKTLLAIAAKLSSSKDNTRAAGATELQELTDPSALPAVDSILASPSPTIATLVIDWLAEVDSVESSQALARYSLVHPVRSTRKYATSKLKQRPPHDFVPDMLEMLSSQVSMMAIPAFDRSGALTGYRHAFAQEKFDKQEIMIIDRAFERSLQAVGIAPSSPNRSRRLAAREERAIAASMDRVVENSLRDFAMGETVVRNAAVREANAEVAQRNARIAEVISTIADQEFTSEPKPMWQWWDKYNETNYQNYKPDRYLRNALTNRVPQYQPARQSHECFVAGTRVVTNRGMKPIERILVGDCVLSRNVATGELSWKPVLRATTRPPETTSIIAVENDQFCCTYGHLFWVSGAGWKRANELKAGDILHAAEEPKVVASVQQGAAAPTYNLEVADNANYFVGNAMIMTHDVTPRTYNRQLVPGQILVQH